MSKDKTMAQSLATQDQEWAECVTWFRDPDNASGAAALTVASVADDAMVLIKLMQRDPRYAEVVQRMVCLVIVEALHRINDQNEANP